MPTEIFLETCTKCRVPMCPSQIEAGTCFKCIAIDFKSQNDTMKSVLEEARDIISQLTDYISNAPSYDVELLIRANNTKTKISICTH